MGDRMSAFTIRRARAEDAAAVGAVFDAAVAQGWDYLGGLEREPLFSAREWDDLVAAHLSGDDVLLVAVDSSGAILGYCAVHSGDGEMYLLFVDPRHGGRGIGRALLTAGHDALRSAGCSDAFLFVHEANARALAVYAAAGYRQDGATRTSEFRGRPIREVRLVLALARAP
jgi:ribosomal protein S18 acetylase RimI-like enzyme